MPGIPTQIHDGNNQDLVGSDLIEKAKREAGSPASTSSRRQGRPSQRLRFDEADRSLDFSQELCA